MQHRKVALSELDHAVNRLGLRTIAIGTNVSGLNLDEGPILSTLELAAKMGVSIVVHPTSWTKAGEARFPRHNFVNSFGSPLEDSLAVMSIVYSGLLDRHPDLRIMFTHGGGWIHFGIGRLNLRYHQSGNGRPMAHAPADYLGRMYFDCLVHDEHSLALLKTRAGAEHIVIGTDYPGSGDIRGGAVNWIRTCGQFSDEEQRNVLWNNAASFLDLPR